MVCTRLDFTPDFDRFIFFAKSNLAMNKTNRFFRFMISALMERAPSNGSLVGNIDKVSERDAVIERFASRFDLCQRQSLVYKLVSAATRAGSPSAAAVCCIDTALMMLVYAGRSGEELSSFVHTLRQSVVVTREGQTKYVSHRMCLLLIFFVKTSTYIYGLSPQSLT